MFVYLQLSAFACTAGPSHQVDAQPCSVGICIQEDVAGSSTAEALRRHGHSESYHASGGSAV